jgi:hypothetical protein
LTGGGILVAIVHFEQLDEERSVVADGVPEILRRSLATLTRAGDAVRGPVLLDELGMLDGDVRRTKSSTG